MLREIASEKPRIQYESTYYEHEHFVVLFDSQDSRRCRCRSVPVVRVVDP